MTVAIVVVGYIVIMFFNRLNKYPIPTGEAPQFQPYRQRSARYASSWAWNLQDAAGSMSAGLALPGGFGSIGAVQRKQATHPGGYPLNITFHPNMSALSKGKNHGIFFGGEVGLQDTPRCNYNFIASLMSYG